MSGKPRFCSPSRIRFARSLKTLRASKEMDQFQLAAASGLSRASVGDYETCRATPRVDNLCRLIDALGCTADELLGREGAP